MTTTRGPTLRYPRFVRVLASLVLAACGGGDLVPPVSPASLVDAWEVASIEAYSSLGPIPHHATLRAENRFGAAVPSGPVEGVLLDGVATAVHFDGQGYGAIEIAAAGTAEITDLEGNVVSVHAVAAGWDGLGLHRAWPSPVGAVEHGAAALTGGVAALGPTVWWVGDGAPPHVVLEAEGDILGLRHRHVDVDGVLDVVAWTGSTVFVLRGRAGGGMGWGAALVASGYTIGGADVGDLSGDDLPDLAVAWVADDGSAVVDLWLGDGLFGFAAAEPRPVSGRPRAIGLADAASDERQQLTVLYDTGQWERFMLLEAQHIVPIGPGAPEDTLPGDGAELPSTGDVQGDGGDDIVVLGAREPGEPRPIFVLDVLTDEAACDDGDPEAQCGTQYVEIVNEPGAEVAVGDANADGNADLLALEEGGRLSAVAYDLASDEAGGPAYSKLTVLEAIEAGPIDLLDADRDGFLDILILGPTTWWRWYGVGHDDLDAYWSARASPSVEVQSDLFLFTHVSKDPGETDFVAVHAEAGSNKLTTFRVGVLGDVAERVGTVDLGPSGPIPTDLAVCGTDAWVALDGDVLRVPIGPAASVAGRAGTAATRVDCGSAPDGAAAAFLDSGSVWLVDRDVYLIGEPVPAPGAMDVAVGDVGSGPEARTCATAGCSIVFFPYGSSGGFAIAESQHTVLADAAGTSTPIGGFGDLSVTDADGDGNLDLAALWSEGNVLTVHRSTGEGVGPAEQWLWEMNVAGPVSAADADGDGSSDLFVLDASGTLWHTLPPPDPVTGDPKTPVDTGDTSASAP